MSSCYGHGMTTPATLPQHVTLTGTAAMLAQAAATKLGVSVDDAAERAFHDLITVLSPRVQRDEREIDRVVTRFIAARCVLAEQAHAPNADVYREFLEWIGRTYSHKSLSMALGRQGFRQRNVRGRGREWVGFTVAEPT